jgi:hypothetical protein
LSGDTGWYMVVTRTWRMTLDSVVEELEADGLGPGVGMENLYTRAIEMSQSKDYPCDDIDVETKLW